MSRPSDLVGVRVWGVGDPFLEKLRKTFPLGAGISLTSEGGAVFVDEGLGRMEAEVQEFTGGIEAVAGRGIFGKALHDVD